MKPNLALLLCCPLTAAVVTTSNETFLDVREALFVFLTHVTMNLWRMPPRVLVPQAEYHCSREKLIVGDGVSCLLTLNTLMN